MLPTTVNPIACIAWYPTRYDAKNLFGPGKGDERFNEVDDEFETAVMAIFAGDDEIPGARKEDAAELKSLLELDSRIKDHMVKVILFCYHYAFIFFCPPYFVLK